MNRTKKTVKNRRSTLLEVKQEPEASPLKNRRSISIAGTQNKTQEYATDLSLDETQDLTTPTGPTRPSLAMVSNIENVAHQTRNIKSIQLGLHQFEPCYFSPYPKELCIGGHIYLCEFCLKPFGSSFELLKHSEKCKASDPPGLKVYSKDGISFFKVDGERKQKYSERLCLLSKAFLEHKNTRYDTTPFIFYVMMETHEGQNKLVGYFSKEKNPPYEYNLSCILALPTFQKQGYGRLLIEFSYELTKMQRKHGTPEVPLSVLGRLAYERFWHDKIMEAILHKVESAKKNEKPTISILNICDLTGIKKKNVISTMKAKGMHSGLQEDENIRLSSENIKSFKESQAKRRVRIDPNYIDPHVIFA